MTVKAVGEAAPREGSDPAQVDRLRDYSPRAVDGFASRRGQRRFLLRIVCEKTKRYLIESLEGCSICDMGLYSHRTGPKTVLKSAL